MNFTDQDLAFEYIAEEEDTTRLWFVTDSQEEFYLTEACIRQAAGLLGLLVVEAV